MALRDGHGRAGTVRFVVKHLGGAAAREAAVYQALAALGTRPPAPRARAASVRAAHACLRVVRRADACWRR